MRLIDEFGDTERRIFEAAASALVGGPVVVGALDAAAGLVMRLPSGDRLLLRGLLRVLEYGPLLAGRFRRFSALPREERERHLRSWAGSRFAMRRQGVAALKTLAMLAHYGQDAAWSDVGYGGPWLGRKAVPVLPAPVLYGAPAAGRRGPGPGITLGRDLREDLVIRSQVCIVGTGAGGAAAAARLAERGVDVVALEAGGHPTAGDFDQRELDMLQLLYQDGGLRSTTDKAIGILQGRGVGGSTLHNTGLVYRTPPGIADRWREEHGFVLAAGELDAYLDWALDALHAVPIPPDRINANNNALRRGADALGWRYRVPLHNRLECCGCGYCMIGCAYNRKVNAALGLLPRAVERGTRILADARATAVRGRRGARRVECTLLNDEGRPTGRRATVEAPVVLIAAGALDSPALLLRSGMGGDRVGRGLRLHPAMIVAAIFPEPIHAWRGLPQSVLVEEFASFMETGRGGFLFIAGAGNWPGLSAVVLPGMGAEHRRTMRRLPDAATASVLLHDETAGRVTARRNGRPAASYWPDPADFEELDRGVRALARLYLAAGAERVHLPYADAPPVTEAGRIDEALRAGRRSHHRVAINSVHPQGSCALAAHRAAGAVDPYGELWGEKGVFVCDTSIFPTSVGVPPQATTMALAAAVADYVAAERT